MSKKAIPSVWDYARLKRGKIVSACMLAVVMGSVVSCSAGLFDAVKKVGGGLTDSLESSFQKCQWSGCTSSASRTLDGSSYCSVHLEEARTEKEKEQRRQQVAEGRKRAEGARIRQKKQDEQTAEAAYQKQLAAAKGEYAVAEEAWRKENCVNPGWGRVIVNGEQLEGLITFNRRNADRFAREMQQRAKTGRSLAGRPLFIPGYGPYLFEYGLADPNVRKPAHMLRQERNSKPNGNSKPRYAQIEGKRYPLLYLEFATNLFTVAEPASWGTVSNDCAAGKTAVHVPFLENVVSNYAGLKLDVVAAEFLDDHYSAIHATNELCQLIAKVPGFRDIHAQNMERKSKHQFESGDLKFKFPYDEFCASHPLLYREMASGASRDWCCQWLKRNAKSFRGHKPRDDDWNPIGDNSKRLKKNEMLAEMDGKVNLRLSFDPERDILVSVLCEFDGEGIAKDTLLAKYRKQFGDACKIEERKGKVEMSERHSSFPMSRKDKRKLQRMAMSSNPIERAAAQAARDASILTSETGDATMYYFQREDIVISGKDCRIDTGCDNFVGCAFMSNANYNRLVDADKVEDLKNWDTTPAEQVKRADGSWVRRNGSDDMSKGYAEVCISEFKKTDGRILSLTITGTPLVDALAAAMKSKEAADKAAKLEEQKKKDAAALNF